MFLVLSVLVSVSALSRVRDDRTSAFSCFLSDLSAVGVGDSLSVVMTFRVDNPDVVDGRAVVVVPSLEKDGHFVSLRPVSVYSRKAVSGKRVCASGDCREVFLSSLRKRMTFEVDDCIAFTEWMDSCQVVLSFFEWRKKGTPDSYVQLSRKQVGVIYRPKAPEFRPEFRIVEPEVSSDTYRTLGVSVPMAFAEGTAKIDTSLAGNGRALDEFVLSLDNFFSSKKASVKSVSFVGWTSLRGGQQANVSVSRKRAQAVASFVQRAGALCGNSYTVKGEGEDWDGFLSWLGRAKYFGDESLKSLVTETDDLDEAADKMEKLYPEAWREMDSLCFPLLDRISCDIVFKAPSFKNVESLLSAYRAEPRVLSAHDFWSVSKEMEEGSDEWLDVWLRCADLYPEDGTVNLNAAQALLMNGHLADASFYLSRAKDGVMATYVNALWKMSREEYADAVQLLDGIKARSSRAARAWEYLDYLDKLRSNRDVKYIYSAL